jgi:hypothetical protein
MFSCVLRSVCCVLKFSWQLNFLLSHIPDPFYHLDDVLRAMSALFRFKGTLFFFQCGHTAAVYEKIL